MAGNESVCTVPDEGQRMSCTRRSVRPGIISVTSYYIMSYYRVLSHVEDQVQMYSSSLSGITALSCQLSFQQQAEGSYTCTIILAALSGSMGAHKIKDFLHGHL